MEQLLAVALVAGVAPLATGFAVLARAPAGFRMLPAAASVVLCALAFNLVFVWQELWLVIPKALTPGLHPVLYHNDHAWTGHAPAEELLQGTGALATLILGVVCAAAVHLPRIGPGWRLFFFWMAFQGLYQSLTQAAIGALLPANDFGRALAYLHASTLDKYLVLACSVTMMAAAGATLTRIFPHPRAMAAAARSRAFALSLVLTLALSLPFIVPFRLPRNAVEVLGVPALVNLCGAGWLALGAVVAQPREADAGRPGLFFPVLAYTAALLFCQTVLRRGIAF